MGKSDFLQLLLGSLFVLLPRAIVDSVCAFMCHVRKYCFACSEEIQAGLAPGLHGLIGNLISGERSIQIFVMKLKYQSSQLHAKLYLTTTSILLK